jgi:hypothetical protein
MLVLIAIFRNFFCGNVLALEGYNFLFHQIFRKRIMLSKDYFSSHPRSYKYNKKSFKKLLVFFFLWNKSILQGRSLIHSMLKSVMNNMRNFYFWTIIASFEKNNIWSLFFNSISTIFSKKIKIDIE